MNNKITIIDADEPIISDAIDSTDFIPTTDRLELKTLEVAALSAQLTAKEAYDKLRGAEGALQEYVRGMFDRLGVDGNTWLLDLGKMVFFPKPVDKK